MNDDLQQQVQEAIDELIESGAERGLQVAVCRHGEPVVDAVAGVADPTTGRPVTSDTPFFSYSVGKGVAATVVHVLAERGVIDYDTPIVELWPEFGAHGKDRATVRHALSQSAGVPGLPAGLTVEDMCDWEKMCALIAGAEPWWEPGTKIGYHAVTWGYIVGEIVRRATGKPISQVLREEVAGPLGVADELFFAVPAAEQGKMARLEDAEGSAGMFAAMPADSPVFKLGPPECTTAAYGNRADVRSANIPAGGTVTARAVARMYAALLGEVGGVRLISPERLREVSAVAMSGPDQIFGFPTSWGLGYSIGHILPDAQDTQTVFGVGGVGGSHAYDDTATGVAFALTKNRLAPSFDTAQRVAGIVTNAVAANQPLGGKIMSTGGLSTARLGRMREVLTGHVERGAVPGLVALVSRRGEVHVEAIGRQRIDGEPMRRDTIFRVFSLTKPIAAAAAMILVEECRLRLDDPVDPFLPELADRRVLTRLDGPLAENVPAERPITLRDLLTFRLGFGLILGSPDAYPILRAMNELELGQGPPGTSSPPEPDEWIRRLGTLPLMHQPGERWMYNTGSDVLGVLIARATGQPFETFLRERVYEPLGMTDTAFSVPAAKLDRFATDFWEDAKTGTLTVFDPAAGGQWSRPPAFPSGAGGLVSTVDDYLAFGRMLLNGGKHGTERILSRPAVELMTTDQLTPEQRATAGPILGENRGWGFGVSIVSRRDDVAANPGRFGWDGGLEVTWFSDPREDLVAVLMTQCTRFSELSAGGPAIWRDFYTLVYAAIDD